MFYLKHAPKAVLLVLALLLAGCGKEHLPIKGRVTFDGTPVDGGVILFVPEPDASGKPSSASTGGKIIAGEYTLDGERGPFPGRYRVLITWKQKTGQKITRQSDGLQFDEMVQVIPQEYNSATTLTAEVATNKTTFDFDLKSS